MRSERLLGLAVLALICGRERPAAAGMFELLDWACNPGGALKGTGETEALALCHMTAGEKKVCDVVAGQPFACFDPQTYSGKQTCEDSSITLTIQASTPQTLGWKIEGTVVIDAGYTTTFEGDECRPSIRTPLNDTGTGTFVRRAGKAKLTAEFHASGTGYITFLGGKLFGKEYTKDCVAPATAPKGYITDTKSGCKASCATKTPGAAAGLAADQCTDDPGDDGWISDEPTLTTALASATSEAP